MASKKSVLGLWEPKVNCIEEDVKSLLELCVPKGPLCYLPRNVVADVSRKGKWFLKTLRNLKAGKLPVRDEDGVEVG